MLRSKASSVRLTHAVCACHMSESHKRVDGSKGDAFSSMRKHSRPFRAARDGARPLPPSDTKIRIQFNREDWQEGRPAVR